MGAGIAIAAGVALLALLGGGGGGNVVQNIHENRMDRVHNRVEVRAHRTNARVGVAADYTVIRQERHRPERVAYTYSGGGGCVGFAVGSGCVGYTAGGGCRGGNAGAYYGFRASGGCRGGNAGAYYSSGCQGGAGGGYYIPAPAGSYYPNRPDGSYPSGPQGPGAPPVVLPPGSKAVAPVRGLASNCPCGNANCPCGVGCKCMPACDCDRQALAAVRKDATVAYVRR